MVSYSEVFETIWNFVLQFIEFIPQIWGWLTDEVTIGFNIQPVENETFGFLINWAIDLLNGLSIKFTPLLLFSGTIFFTLLVFMFVKKFIPMA